MHFLLFTNAKLVLKRNVYYLLFAVVANKAKEIFYGLILYEYRAVSVLCISCIPLPLYRM